MQTSAPFLTRISKTRHWEEGDSHIVAACFLTEFSQDGYGELCFTGSEELRVTCLGLQGSSVAKAGYGPSSEWSHSPPRYPNSCSIHEGPAPRLPGHSVSVLHWGPLLWSWSHQSGPNASSPHICCPLRQAWSPHCWPLHLLEPSSLHSSLRAQHPGVQPPETYLGGPGTRLGSLPPLSLGLL